MPERSKICARCKCDVSGKPRTKDKQGRYFCAECVKALRAKQKDQASPARDGVEIAVAPPAVAQSGGDVMSALVNDAVSSLGEPCPECQSPMPEGAVMCTRCGYNAASGKALKTRVQEVKEPGKGGEIAKAAASAGLEAATPLLALLGGLIGGGIGAGIWALVAYQTGWEIGWLAWGVGVLVGFGVAIGSRGYTSWLTGSIAAVIAIIAVFAGRYVAVQFIVDDMLQGKGQFAELLEPTEDDAKAFMADEVCREFLDQGQPLRFRDGASLGDAWFPEGYPTVVRDEVNKRWRELSPSEQHAYVEGVKLDMVTFTELDARTQLADEIAEEWYNQGKQIPNEDDFGWMFYPYDYPQELVDEAEARWAGWSEGERQSYIAAGQAVFDQFEDAMQSAVVGMGFVATFGLFDVIFVLLAIVSAYGVGANGGDYFSPT